MTNTHNVMAPKGPSWSPLKNSALKSVRNIFSAVHKPKCVHEYLNKNSINKNNNDTFKGDLKTDAIST